MSRFATIESFVDYLPAEGKEVEEIGLCLRSITLSDENVQAIIDKFNQLINLIPPFKLILELLKVNISDIGISNVASALNQFSKLHYIQVSLTSIKLKREHLVQFAQSISQLSNSTTQLSLKFDASNLHHGDIDPLISTISSGAFPPNMSLSLSSNSVSDKRAIELAEALKNARETHQKEISLIDLSKNKISIIGEHAYEYAGLQEKVNLVAQSPNLIKENDPDWLDNETIINADLLKSLISNRERILEEKNQATSKRLPEIMVQHADFMKVYQQNPRGFIAFFKRARDIALYYEKTNDNEATKISFLAPGAAWNIVLKSSILLRIVIELDPGYVLALDTDPGRNSMIIRASRKPKNLDSQYYAAIPTLVAAGCKLGIEDTYNESALYKALRDQYNEALKILINYPSAWVDNFLNKQLQKKSYLVVILELLRNTENRNGILCRRICWNVVVAQKITVKVSGLKVYGVTSYGSKFIISENNFDEAMEKKSNEIFISSIMNLDNLSKELKAAIEEIGLEKIPMSIIRPAGEGSKLISEYITSRIASLFGINTPRVLILERTRKEDIIFRKTKKYLATISEPVTGFPLEQNNSLAPLNQASLSRNILFSMLINSVNDSPEHYTLQMDVESKEYQIVRRCTNQLHNEGIGNSVLYTLNILDEPVENSVKEFILSLQPKIFIEAWLDSIESILELSKEVPFPNLLNIIKNIYNRLFKLKNTLQSNPNIHYRDLLKITQPKCSEQVISSITQYVSQGLSDSKIEPLSSAPVQVDMNRLKEHLESIHSAYVSMENENQEKKINVQATPTAPGINFSNETVSDKQRISGSAPHLATLTMLSSSSSTQPDEKLQESKEQTIVLLDVDETSVLSNPDTTYRYNDELFSALKSCGLTEVYLFTSYSLFGIATTSENEKYGAASRLKLIKHMEEQGIKVKGVITSLDPVYDEKGIGYCYDKKIKLFEAYLLEGINLQKGKQGDEYIAARSEQVKLADQYPEIKKMMQKDSLFLHTIKRLSEKYPGTKFSFIMIDDSKYNLEQVKKCNEEKTQMPFLFIRAQPELNASDYTQQIQGFLQNAQKTEEVSIKNVI